MISFLGEPSQTYQLWADSNLCSVSEADSSTKIQQQWSSLQTY